MLGLFYLFLAFVVYNKILQYLNEVGEGYAKKKEKNDNIKPR